ncbi:uncharacterized protein ARMOST_11402 [Armillaria ostoyae]|uniref:Uncharacterized protein n=1 Tax=Armillaria ostoyae TaxID=47428 RepID=A0A284RH07_ARMOS|nr:uncharacterized protein ARMOST_11402 [Armillaria ostoyae]
MTPLASSSHRHLASLANFPVPGNLFDGRVSELGGEESDEFFEVWESESGLFSIPPVFGRSFEVRGGEGNHEGQERKVGGKYLEDWEGLIIIGFMPKKAALSSAMLTGLGTGSGCPRPGGGLGIDHRSSRSQRGQ